MTWAEAAAALDGFEPDFGDWTFTQIDGEAFGILAHRRGNDVLYCRASTHDPARLCLIASVHEELLS
jgi:hypothetical protein